MKVKVKKEFELNCIYKAMEDDILDLITINYENDSLFVILEKYGHIFNVYFEDEYKANEHLEFDYEEETMASSDTYITENESNKRVAEVFEEQQKKIEYWKSKCMKLIEML